MSESPAVRLVLGDLEQELATTRRMLERVPEEHLGWKPHEKSMSLGGLAQHVADLHMWQLAMVEEDGYDLASAPSRSAPPTSRAEILAAFDRNVTTLRAALQRLSHDALSETWTLRQGDHVILRQPRAVALRSLGISHVIHHRGQLSVYLRLLDVPVPPAYGPTADEQMA